MIDFSRKPTPKSAEEQEFDRLNAEYEEKFGEPYTLRVGFGASWAETLEDIRKRISANDPQSKPDYEPGNVY